MSTLRDKDLTKFVRFGSINLTYQKGYNKDSYHTAPARKGFYAFPHVIQERFLIGCLYKTQKDVFKKTNEDGFYEDWEDYEQKLKQIRKVFVKKDGYVWHHLLCYTKPNEIVAINKEWVKTTIKDWMKIVSRSSINDRMDFNSKSFNEKNGICGSFSKDNYEVFFDETP